MNDTLIGAQYSTGLSRHNIERALVSAGKDLDHLQPSDLARTGSRGRAPGDIALPSTTFERGLNAAQGQMSTLSWGGGPAQHTQGIAVRQVLEGRQRGRVVLAQRRAQRVGVPGELSRMVSSSLCLKLVSFFRTRQKSRR
jgi:hypothetical protein